MSAALFKLEEIHWDDAASFTGWRLATDPEIKLGHCITVGWVIKEDKKMVMIAGTKGLDEESQGEDKDQFNEVGVIPKGMITARRILSP